MKSRLLAPLVLITSSLFSNAININDRGEILAKSIPLGVIPIDDEDPGHLVLLVPCDEGRGDSVKVLATDTDLGLTQSVRPQVTHSSAATDAFRAWRKNLEAHRRSAGPEQ